MLDGEDVGALRRGETKDFEFAAGPHEVRLTIDWVSSNTVEFDGTEQLVLLDCGNEHGGWKALLAIIWITLGKDSLLWAPAPMPR